MNIKNIKKKGLRYFSQMFEEEEQQNEIQIGAPTDVKHVAHIGWDGPSASAPAWMNEFKSQSAPLDSGAEPPKKEDDEDKGHKGASSSRDMPGLPKISRVRHPSMDSIGSANESPVGSPTSQGRSIKNKDKGSTKSTGSSRRRKDKSSSKQKEQTGGDEGGAQILPNIPKKSRRKKSKDVEGGSVRVKSSSKRGSRAGSMLGSEDGSVRSTASGMGTLEEED